MGVCSTHKKARITLKINQVCDVFHFACTFLCAVQTKVPSTIHAIELAAPKAGSGAAHAGRIILLLKDNSPVKPTSLFKHAATRKGA